MGIRVPAPGTLLTQCSPRLLESKVSSWKLSDLGMVTQQVCGKTSIYASASQIIALSLKSEQSQLPIQISVP